MIPEDILKKTIKSALASGGDFADVFAEDKLTNVIRLEDGKIEGAVSGRSRGAGVRVIAGGITGYAFTDEISQEALIKTARAAGAVIKNQGGRAIAVDLREKLSGLKHFVEQRPEAIAGPEKAEIVRRADETARGLSKEIRQVSVLYADSAQKVLLANSEGLLVRDERIYTRLTVQVVAMRDGIIQTGVEGPGGQMGFEFFRHNSPEEVARIAGGRALTMLAARPAPAGRMPVIIEAGSGGVLFHEACGHGLEADLVLKKASVYLDRLGERVASGIVTAIDDSTISQGWGSFCFDDEGSPAQKTVLIEEGRLSSYLHSRITAQKAGCLSTGNGRRQSYGHIPIPRMTNTFIAPGDASFEEMIESTERGLYAKALGGGQVDTATGDFVFGVSEGYLIENGRVTAPVRGATLIGNGPRILEKIDLIASNLDFRAGTCGKEDQAAPVGTGQPTLRIAELTVGGTEA